jgi:hypothetical protein
MVRHHKWQEHTSSAEGYKMRYLTRIEKNRARNSTKPTQNTTCKLELNHTRSEQTSKISGVPTGLVQKAHGEQEQNSDPQLLLDMSKLHWTRQHIATLEKNQKVYQTVFKNHKI